MGDFWVLVIMSASFLLVYLLVQIFVGFIASKKICDLGVFMEITFCLVALIGIIWLIIELWHA